MDKPAIPPELALAAHYFCDLTGKDPKGYTDETQTTQNWEGPAVFIGNVITAQRAMYLASKQINEEEAAAKASQNGGEEEIDLDALPDPQVILVE